MASTIYFGNSGFKYTPPGGVLTTLTLAAPLRDIRAAFTRRKFIKDSLDYTVREVIVVGAGVEEMWGTIRYDNEPDKLKAMLRHGLEGVTLTYYPNLGVPGTNYPCLLVEINNGDGDEAEITPDTDLWFKGAYMATIRMRRTDGGNFDPLLP